MSQHRGMEAWSAVEQMEPEKITKEFFVTQKIKYVSFSECDAVCEREKEVEAVLNTMVTKEDVFDVGQLQISSPDTAVSATNTELGAVLVATENKVRLRVQAETYSTLGLNGKRTRQGYTIETKAALLTQKHKERIQTTFSASTTTTKQPAPHETHPVCRTAGRVPVERKPAQWDTTGLMEWCLFGTETSQMAKGYSWSSPALSVVSDTCLPSLLGSGKHPAGTEVLFVEGVSHSLSPVALCVVTTKEGSLFRVWKELQK
ncbi:MAG: uncharacterized protein A8A55_0168 [Amphiamblys sp. WSBS2006]|nr:MAG: uncharacterized protein A8A55_0180 [Amphiamblys sp. WSBS2006]OIR59019.1 MAG: uncharacterized protein A8A55_0168 [Amphiamblys sp. WSBS2006]